MKLNLFGIGMMMVCGLAMGCASSSSTGSNSTETAADADSAQSASDNSSPKSASGKTIIPECKSKIVQMVTKQDGSHQYLLEDSTLWQVNADDTVQLVKKLPDSAANYKLIPSNDVIIHYTGDKIMLIHVETGTELFRLAGDPALKTVLYTPNNQEMAIREAGNIFNIWNVPDKFSGIQLAETVQDFINRQSPDRKMKFSVDAYAVSMTNEGRAILASDDVANNKIGLIYFMDDKNAKGVLKSVGRTNSHITHLAIPLSARNVAAVDENGKLYVSSTGEDKGFKAYGNQYTDLINVKFVGENVLAIAKDKLTLIDIATGTPKWTYDTAVKTCYAPNERLIICSTDDTIEEIDGVSGHLKRYYAFNGRGYGIVQYSKMTGTMEPDCFQ